MKNSLSSIAILLSSFLLGCGERSKSPAAAITNYTYTNKLEKYHLFDPACQSHSRFTELGRFSIYQWNDYFVAKTYGDFKGFTSSTRLSSQNISNIIHSESGKYDVEGNYYIGSGALGLPLKICNTAADLGQKSIETVALATAYAVEKSHAFYSATTHLKLDPIVLNILPTYHIIDGTNARYFANNASFSPLFKELTMYPQSQRAAAAGEVAMWEMPMVGAHEFGHYVFSQHFPSAYSKRKNYRTTFWQEPKARTGGYANIMNKSLVGNRVVNNELIIDALSEGFADLYGFYTQNEKARGLAGSRCFHRTRSVKSSTFYNGDLKTLDSRTLNLFLSNNIASLKVEHCADPDYQEIHSIGAIIAYGVNELWSQTTSSAHEKAKLLVQWLDKLEEEFSSFQNNPPRIFFNVVVDLAIKLVRVGSFSDNQCSVIKEVFPDFNNENSYCLI